MKSSTVRAVPTCPRIAAWKDGISAKRDLAFGVNHRIRTGFYAGFAVAILTGTLLVRLWRPEQQIRLHSQHLLRALEQRNWDRFAGFIASDYHDQWANDRATLVERTRLVFAQMRTFRLTNEQQIVRRNNKSAHWQSRIIVSGDPSELLLAIKDRVNSLSTPFDLEWRHVSRKPWDWKLVDVTNPELSIPEFIE